MATLQAIDKQLARHFLEDFPIDAARMLETGTPEEILSILNEIDDQTAMRVLTFMARETVASCLTLWPEERIARLLSSHSPGTASRLLRTLDSEKRKSVLNKSGESTAKPIRRLLQYPEDSAGALMNPNVTTVPGDLNVSGARKLIAKSSGGGSGYFYITDRTGALTGVSSIREVLSAAPASSLDVITHKPVVKLLAHTRRSSIESHPGWLSYHSLPVVGNDDILVGVISHCSLRELETGQAPIEEHSPLLYTVGAMYLNVMSRFSEMLVGLFRYKGQKEGEKA